MERLRAEHRRYRVLVFVPRWLPPECGDRRIAHQVLPILGSLTASGCEVLLYEEAFDGSPVRDWLERCDAAVVCCAEMYPASQIPGILAFLDLARRVATPAVVSGGFFPLVDPAGLGIEDRVAAVVTGPGEVVLPNLVAALADRRPLDEVEGIAFWSGGRCVRTPPARRRALDPAWVRPLSELELGRYLRPDRQIFNNDEPSLQIHTGSGCAKRCRFCFDENTPYGVYPAAAVFESAAIVKRRFGVSQFLFGELDFFHRTSRALAVARLLIERKLAIRWFALGSVCDFARLGEDDLDVIAASGCYRIEIGSESGSDRVLAAIGKLHRAADVLEQVRRLDRHGIRTTHNLLFGAPGERPADRRATLRLAGAISRIQPAAHLHLRMYQIVPTTTLGREALRWVQRFPRTLEELADYRLGLQGGSRALPWLSRSDEEWVKRLTRYVLPMAFHDLGREVGGVRRGLLRSLARLRARLGLRLGARLDERMFERGRGRRLASTFVP